MLTYWLYFRINWWWIMISFYLQKTVRSPSADSHRRCQWQWCGLCQMWRLQQAHEIWQCKSPQVFAILSSEKGFILSILLLIFKDFYDTVNWPPVFKPNFANVQITPFGCFNVVSIVVRMQTKFKWLAKYSNGWAHAAAAAR